MPNSNNTGRGNAQQENIQSDRAIVSPSEKPKKNGGVIMQTLKLTDIKIDGGAQPSAEIDNSLIKEHSEAILENVDFPPLRAVFDGVNYWLYNGFHYYNRAISLGTDSVDVEVTNGTVEDARRLRVTTNKDHGLRGASDYIRLLYIGIADPKRLRCLKVLECLMKSTMDKIDGIIEMLNEDKMTTKFPAPWQAPETNTKVLAIPPTGVLPSTGKKAWNNLCSLMPDAEEAIQAQAEELWHKACALVGKPQAEFDDMDWGKVDSALIDYFDEVI